MDNLYDTAERILSSNSTKVKEIKEEMMREAEDLLVGKFPARVLLLEELLRSPQFNLKPSEYLSDVNVPKPPPSQKKAADNGPGESYVETSEVNGTKLLALPGNGVIPLNKVITEMYSVVKPLIAQLVHDCNLLKMWIQFLIPKVEDGNNFGVGIQEDCLAEVRTVEGEAAAFMEQVSSYYLSRGKIVAKVAKYPHIEDFRRTVEEMDQKHYIAVRLTVTELRNHYSSLHDIITKNIDKIKRPRTSNAANLY